MFEAELRIEAYRPITHRRRIVFSRGLGYLLVEDRLDAPRRRNEQYVQLWHLREGSRPKVDGSTVRTRRNRGNIVIRQLTNVRSTRIVAGHDLPPQGWVSYRYRRLRPAPVVHARIDGNRARFLTLLVPVLRDDTPVRVSDLTVTPDSVRLVVRVGRRAERISMTRRGATITKMR